MRTFRRKVWPYVTVIVACVAWMLVNTDKVVDNISLLHSWYGESSSLEGQWSNSIEGHLEAPDWLSSQSELVELRLTIKDSSVDGTIMSGRLKSLIPFEYVLLGGSKRMLRNTLDAYAFDFVSGKRINFGSFIISLDGERLVIDADEAAQNYFPKQSILIKTSNTAFPELETRDESGDDKSKKQK